jgi:hypothetical protein
MLVLIRWEYGRDSLLSFQPRHGFADWQYVRIEDVFQAVRRHRIPFSNTFQTARLSTSTWCQQRGKDEALTSHNVIGPFERSLQESSAARPFVTDHDGLSSLQVRASDWRSGGARRHPASQSHCFLRAVTRNTVSPHPNSIDRSIQSLAVRSAMCCRA